MSSSRNATSHSPQPPKKLGAGTADILRRSRSTPELDRIPPDARPTPPAHVPQAPSPIDEAIAREKQTYKRIGAAPEHLGLSCMRKTDKRPDKKTFHAVEVVKREGETYFFKHHQLSLNPLLPELEAVAWSFYHLVAPDKVPEEVNAHFNANGQYVGVSVKGIKGFKSLYDLPLTKEDLNDDEILKGLGVGLTLSYIFAEDDMHTGNISKAGDRIDFDMSLYPVLGRFKQNNATITPDYMVELNDRYVTTRIFDGTIIDWKYRPYTKENYEIDEADIRSFPDIHVASPFYWVTKSAGPVHTDIRQGFHRAFPTSTNAYAQVDMDNYKKLTNINTFRRHMFKTLLKFLLIDANHFTTEAKKHIRNDLKWQDEDGKIRPIYESLVNFVKARQQTLERKLIQMVNFSEFLNKDGSWALEEIIKELVEANIKQTSDQFKHQRCKSRLFENDTEASIRTNNSTHHIDSVRERFRDIVYQTTNHIYKSMQQTDTDMFTALLKLVLMGDKEFIDVAKGYLHMYQSTIEKHSDFATTLKTMSNRRMTCEDKHKLRDLLVNSDEFRKFIEENGSNAIATITAEIDRDPQHIKLDYDAVCRDTLHTVNMPRMNN